MSLIEDSKHLRIPFEDIRDATQNFTTLIGRGGYGPVYRGQLSFSGEPMVVAVKRLQRDHRSGQGLKEFLTEIQLLSRYKHRNIVSLVGFCEELNEKFLIYEYAEYGSLDNYLNPAKKRGLLTWKQRINICIDAARGLDHLHYGVAQNQRVIHRDIKSANILLDHNWKAMIADFGLSKIGRANENDTYLITNASGTHGYCDPAYIRTGILTKESDIYSFGVVLFELLCGRLCFMNVDSEERFLAPLAQRYYEEGKLNLIIDRDLKSYMNSDSMKVFSEIAFHCLNDDRKLRPSMNLVLKKLEIALSLLDKEEAPELLELEEALEMRKLVESLQIQQFEEACEVQELQEALGLHKLVETLQLQQFKEVCEMHELEEALGLRKLVETLQQHEFEETLKSQEAWKFQEHLEHPQCGFDNDCHEIEELSASEDVKTSQVISDYDTDSRPQIVTFVEPESSVMVQYESDSDESVMPERPHANPNIKKGSCHRCLKGNRFTMKESCIVCDAKYCSKCVLKVMGPMSEGRKCITCIGHPIEESKRGQLGKCSRVLKQVLTDFQVEQVMLAEKSCQANQAPHWLIFVNSRDLSLEEMYQLQTCSHPPKRLVPGSYWYDKLSGFWGEEGRKPSQIITPGLSIGGDIMENASKGSTNVMINCRVITKRELLMLKLVGINLKGSPRYWVSHNGTYEEEGQKPQNGKIWEKRGIKMACVLLSLPMPPKSFHS